MLPEESSLLSMMADASMSSTQPRTRPFQSNGDLLDILDAALRLIDPQDIDVSPSSSLIIQ